MEYLEIYDSSLRDGGQGEGISFSLNDKLHIVSALDRLGVAYIEAGNPGSHPKDQEFFDRARTLRLQTSRLVAFGSTRRKDASCDADDSIRALLEAGTETVAVFGKCWDLHAERVLGATLSENLAMIADTVRYLTGQGRRVIFDGEHFFDGYKANPRYALECLRAAREAGAVCLCLCDTNGGALPEEIEKAVKASSDMASGAMLSIHCHNDCGLAAANTLAGVRSGAGQVQGTFLGYGERCGNVNLSTVIPLLELRLGIRCLPKGNLALLTRTANEIAQISNLPLQHDMPFVGRSAFAHKAGMHADGVLKTTRSFEHINPELVGNERRFLVSEIAGRKIIAKKVEKIVPGLAADSPELQEIISELKEQERRGYQFEGAEGSFALLVRRVLGKAEPSFQLVSYKILDELPYDNGASATATIKVRVGGRLQVSAAEGEGPVNALDKALRSALEIFYPQLARVQLVDYKVRVMEPKDATAALVRVLITTTDGKTSWTTVGVSNDVIEASWLALVDSIEYKLHVAKELE